jgi:hypothetical protein
MPMWVRPEYERLGRDFPALAAHFGIAVDAALAGELVELIAVFETVDRHVDSINDAAARAQLAASIVRALRAEAALDDELDRELGASLAALRRLTARGGALPADVVGNVERFFARSETLRTTTDARTFVQAVVDEAAPACELALLVAARVTDAEFARFFAVLSEVANLVDKLHDVRGDRRRGEIAVRTGTRLHARLVAAFVVRCALLLRLAPRPLSLIVWGARYLVPPST